MGQTVSARAVPTKKGAPRYTLKKHEQSQLRFARPRKSQQTFRSEIFDLSNNGIGFTAQGKLAPEVGESIVIEFKVPGGQYVSTFGEVARVVPFQKESSNLQWFLVGVSFRNWPENNRNFLQRALELHAVRKTMFFFNSVADNPYRRFNPEEKRRKDLRRNLLGLAAVTGLLFALFYSLILLHGRSPNEVVKGFNKEFSIGLEMLRRYGP